MASRNASVMDDFYAVFPDYNPWFYAILGTLLVGLTGILPVLVIPVEAGHKLREGGIYTTVYIISMYHS